MIDLFFRPISPQVVQMQLEYVELIEKFRELQKLLEDIDSRDAAVVRKLSWKYYIMLEKMCHGPVEEEDLLEE